MKSFRPYKILSTALLTAFLTVPAWADYNANDDTAASVLQTFYNSSGLWDGTFAGWGDAEALETVENTILRLNGQSYLPDIATTYNDNYSGGFIDSYYDDEGWWCNAWIRAYDLTGNVTYLNMAKSIYSDIVGGWNTSTCGGGLWWEKPNNYKSSISNELFLLESIRLHERTPGDTYYLNWAQAEWNWFSGTGVINGNNLINDGVDSTTCGNNNGGVYTYNQGVILAGLTDMYKVTLNGTYLAKAEAIANAVLNSSNGLVNSSGIITQGGSGDGSEFNGIFARYLFYLYDTDHNSAYYNFLAANAQSIWANDRDGSNQLGYLWTGPVQLSMPGSHVSSMDPGSVIAKPWTTTLAYARGAGDQELNHSTGYATGTLGWACDLTSSPSSSFMQWGPYVSYLSAGSHTIHYRLAVASTNCSPVSLVTLQVTSNSGTVTLGTMNVPWAAFAQANVPQDFAVSYTDNTANDSLEFRVIWNAATGSPKVTLTDITVDGNYNWTAANLTHDIGRLDGVNNWEADSVKDPASGYMIRGPGTAELGNANCQATFEMKVDNFSYDTAQVATLSVVDTDTGSTVASQNVTRNQFPNILFQNFVLNFTTQLGHHYDYRVYYYVFNNSPRLTVRGIYTNVLSNIAVATPTPVCSGGGIFGNNAAGVGGYNLAGQIDCARYALSQAMTVTSISIYMGSGTSCNGVLGIYSDSSGPGNLLVQGVAQPLFAGWNTVAITPTLLQPGNYWLSGSFNGNAVFDYSNANGGAMMWTNYTYSGTLPCSVSNLTGYGWLMSIYASGCMAPTPTFTPTATSTRTSTPTSTPTVTNTMTSTVSSTFTSTPTYTYSSTSTKTPVPPTATSTSTNTLVPATATDSMTPTASFTVTPSATPTLSPTGTVTPVPTGTFTNTATSTSTASSTGTSTWTATKTATPVPPTVTATFTYTFSPTVTVTNTATSTKTNTSTFTSTPTWTLTPTLTATKTATGTFTATFTWTKTNTPIPTATWTSTKTSTPTATSTPTPSSACAGIPQWNGNFVAYAAGQKVSYNGELYQCIQSHTSEPNWEPNVVPALWKDIGPCGATSNLVASLTPVVYPNPVTTDNTNILLPKMNASSVKVTIYTVAMRQVGSVSFGQVPGDVVTLRMVDKAGVGLADGLYYFVIQCDGSHWTNKVLVLR